MRSDRLGFILGVLLAALCSACDSTEDTSSYLTFTAERTTFRATVEAVGTLEAKTSHVLVTPQVWPAPKISYLALEGSPVQKGDLVVKFESEDIERQHLTALNELEVARAEAKKTDAELQLNRLLLESERKNSEAAAAISKLQLSRLEFAARRTQELKGLEIQKSELEAEKMRKKLASLESIQKEERARLQMKTRQAEGRVKQCRISLDRLELKAPVAGAVVYERNQITGRNVQEGDQLYPGMPVAKVPELSAMQVTVQVGETQVQKLKPGQRATIVVPTLGNREFPGKVGKVAPVAKPVTKGSGVRQVEVIVEIDSSRAELVPGLTARTSVIVEEIPDVIVAPLDCVFEKDSLRVAYVRESSGFTRREIKLGGQNEDFAVIKSGLRAGEVLSLQEPAHPVIR